MLNTDNFTTFLEFSRFKSLPKYEKKARVLKVFSAAKIFFFQNLCSGHPIGQFVIFLNFSAFSYWLIFSFTSFFYFAVDYWLNSLFDDIGMWIIPISHTYIIFLTGAIAPNLCSHCMACKLMERSWGSFTACK